MFKSYWNECYSHWLTCLSCLSNSIFSMHRVFISNLQKEIEKQTGYRSSRKRRSESQYDYEVYHSLEEVDVKPTICLPISRSPLLSNLMHTQRKQTSSLRCSQTPNYPLPQVFSPTALCPQTQRHALNFRHFSAFQSAYFPKFSWLCQVLWSRPRHNPTQMHIFYRHTNAWIAWLPKKKLYTVS